MKLRFVERFLSHPAALPALFGLIVILLLALLGQYLSPFHPLAADPHAQMLPPVWQQGGVALHPLGTDDLGRDMLSRLLAGARLTMGSATVALLLALSAGVLLGSIAALGGGIADVVLTRTMDVLLAFPSLLLAILLALALGHGIAISIAAVAIALTPHFFRVSRQQLREEIGKDYVDAAKLDGAGPVSLYLQTLLPNMAPAIVVQGTSAFSTAVLDIAALGFLGLGAEASVPEWGNLLIAAHDFIQIAPWTVTLPGIAILLTVLCANLVGDALRDAVNPRGAPN